MKLTIGGEEKIKVTQEVLWEALNDPDVLTKCIPGCSSMTETAPDAYKILMELKVAAVGGSFEGAIALSDKVPPSKCRISVSGEGTLGQGEGNAELEIVCEGAEFCLLKYQGTGEMGGLVAGVGQRVLGGVSKYLIKRFFKSLRKELEPVAAETTR